MICLNSDLIKLKYTSWIIRLKLETFKKNNLIIEFVITNII